MRPIISNESLGQQQIQHPDSHLQRKREYKAFDHTHNEGSQRAVTLHTNHSKLDVEVVIVDDNSPDGTQDAVKEMQDKFGSGTIVVQ